MFAVALLVAHKLRAGWRGWTGLALIIALAGGAVLTAAAGASRTDTAYPRFLAQSRASDVLVAPAGSGVAGFDAAVGTLPGVKASAALVGINAGPVTAEGLQDQNATTVASLDGRYGRTVDIPKMLAGRLPSPSAPREVAVNQIGAKQLNLHVGSVLTMAALANSPHPRLVKLTEHVVGIFVTRGSVLPVTYSDRDATVLASIALYRQLGPDYEAFDGAYVTLKPGTSLATFSAAAENLAKRYPSTGRQVFTADETTQAATVERLIRPQAIALALFGLALALTALLIVGQVAARTLQTAAQDNGTLAALGMTRRQLFAASMAETAAATVAGALGAVAVAIAASPLTPIGPARLAEPDPGVSVNAGILAAGAAAIVVLLAARVAVTAWRQAGARPAADVTEPSQRRPLLAERLSRAGAPLAAAIGVRFALDPGTRPRQRPGAQRHARPRGRGGRGRRRGHVRREPAAPRRHAEPVRPGLEHRARGPVRRRDAEAVHPDHRARARHHRHHVRPARHGHHRQNRDPRDRPGAGNRPDDVLDGDHRAPARHRRPDRARRLGAPPARAASRPNGQGRRPSGTRPMLITGSAVFPYFGQGSFTPTDAGEGAETTAAVLAPLANAGNGGPGGYNFALVSFAPGPARQAHIAAFQRAWSSFCAAIQQDTCLVTDQRPNTVTNFAAIDATPEILAGVLAVLGLAVLAQFILASARRRRRDFALLKVLGMFRRDLSAVAFWQVATVTAVALVVGVPLGIAGGRWAWQLFADQAGLTRAPITPLPVLWMIPATLLVAALVALPPARSVARVPAAATLRSE